MNYPENNEARSSSEELEPQPPLLDGTVHLGDAEDEAAPRVRGLVELLGRFLDRRVSE